MFIQSFSEIVQWNIRPFLYLLHLRVLTSSTFSMAHLKVNASVEFPGDQSVGHDHHQPRDCKQHEQQQDVPAGGVTITTSLSVHGRIQIRNITTLHVTL